MLLQSFFSNSKLEFISTVFFFIAKVPYTFVCKTLFFLNDHSLPNKIVIQLCIHTFQHHVINSQAKPKPYHYQQLIISLCSFIHRLTLFLIGQLSSVFQFLIAVLSLKTQFCITSGIVKSCQG